MKKEEKKSVTYQGVTYNWGDKVISPNGYVNWVVTDGRRWGLVDESGATFCPLSGCDLSEYIIEKNENNN